jgi:hypothetical protein
MIKRIYIVEFEKNGINYSRAFTDLDQVRIHLIHGWELPYDESKIEKLDTKGIIYNQDNIVIKQIGIVR